MGSSAMGASVLRNKIKKAGFADITVVNVAIANLVDDVDLIVTHQDLTAAGPGQSAQRAARLGGQLHEQPEVRRDRRRTQDHQPAAQRRAGISLSIARSGSARPAFPGRVSALLSRGRTLRTGVPRRPAESAEPRAADYTTKEFAAA